MSMYESLPKNTFIFTLIVFSLSIFPMFIISLYLRNKNNSIKLNYDIEKHHALLSLMRENYEDKIAELNSRLLATEERWKDVNHLLMKAQDSHQYNDMKNSINTNNFLKNFGVDIYDKRIDSNLVFVLTPFGKNEFSTFNVIQMVIARYGFRCVRGDEEFVKGDILPHIVSLIVRCRFVVANISGRNPNVYYELGIAHALGKPTILVSRGLKNVPFDLQSKNIVIFENNFDLEHKLRESIARLSFDEKMDK